MNNAINKTFYSIVIYYFYNIFVILLDFFYFFAIIKEKTGGESMGFKFINDIKNITYFNGKPHIRLKDGGVKAADITRQYQKLNVVARKTTQDNLNKFRLAQVTKWVKLKFACVNLKKFALHLKKKGLFSGLVVPNVRC